MKKLILVAAAFAALLSLHGNARAEDSAVMKTVMTPDFARKVGEMNAAVGRCGFEYRETEKVMEKLPMYYLSRERKDLLGQSFTAAMAFNERYKADPVTTCDNAKSKYWLTFK